MREEEKLARDLYKLLSDTWGLAVFTNIIRAEQQHMNMVKAVLDKYRIIDPVQDDTPGTFIDPEIEALYSSPAAKGRKSRLDALQVGMIVEDLDIKDLYDEREKADSSDIKIVCQNLVKGPRIHMRAFMRQLNLHGETYQAKHLSQKEIDTIAASPMQRGPVHADGKPASFSGARPGGNSSCVLHPRCPQAGCGRDVDFY